MLFVASINGGEYKIKIILAMFSRNDRVLGISNTLMAMGHEVIIAYTDEYAYSCSYVEKKLDELGVHKGRNAYNKGWLVGVYDIIDSAKADVFLFINIPVHILSVEDLQKIHNKVTVKCWFVDGVHEHLELLPYYQFIDNIYVFERNDIDYLRERNVHNVEYVPVGYNMNYHKLAIRSPELDIIFIGSPFKNRLQILEAISKQAIKQKWKLKIIGPFYNRKYFWKKYLGGVKYPYIARFLENRSVSADEANQLYNNARICLNIHDVKHKSLNPRSFDILAAGGFEIVDVRDGYVGDIQPDKALATYRDINELLAKIEYYLNNDAEREKIAEYGHEHNIYSMEYSLGQVLD